VTIGREGDDVICLDPVVADTPVWALNLISRRHASIALGAAGPPVLTDFSMNGCEVDGKGADKNVAVPLTDGSTILFGARGQPGCTKKRKKWVERHFKYVVRLGAPPGALNLPIRQFLETIHTGFGNLYGAALKDAGYDQLSFIDGDDELFDNMMKTLRDSTGNRLPHYKMIEKAARKALGLPPGPSQPYAAPEAAPHQPPSGTATASQPVASAAVPEPAHAPPDALAAVTPTASASESTSSDLANAMPSASHLAADSEVVGEQDGEGAAGGLTEGEEGEEVASDVEMDAAPAELSPTIDDAAPPAETFTSPTVHPSLAAAAATAAAAALKVAEERAAARERAVATAAGRMTLDAKTAAAATAAATASAAAAASSGEEPAAAQAPPPAYAPAAASASNPAPATVVRPASGDDVLVGAGSDSDDDELPLNGRRKRPRTCSSPPAQIAPSAPTRTPTASMSQAGQYHEEIPGSGEPSPVPVALPPCLAAGSVSSSRRACLQEMDAEAVGKQDGEEAAGEQTEGEAVDPARVEAADARVLRPTREDMLDRISGQSSAADGKFACLECGERLESLAAVDKHRRATHQMAMRNDANAQRNGVPAICPECESQFGTLQQLQRHFARKHVTERQFQCASCGLGFKTNPERRAHEGMCIEGLNRGKAIRCEHCGITCMTRHQWRQHRKITKHTNFELQWVDSAAMAAATAEATSAEAAAAAARNATAGEPAVAPLVGLVLGHELAADELLGDGEEAAGEESDENDLGDDDEADDDEAGGADDAIDLGYDDEAGPGGVPPARERRWPAPVPAPAPATATTTAAVTAVARPVDKTLEKVQDVYPGEQTEGEVEEGEEVASDVEMDAAPAELSPTIDTPHRPPRLSLRPPNTRSPHYRPRVSWRAARSARRDFLLSRRHWTWRASQSAT
jgi:hypothetical protein